MDNQMDHVTQKTPLLARLRSHRLTTTFVLLGTLSAGILVGSVITGRVSGKEQQAVDSSDARPLSIPDPVTLSTGFSKIAKEVGPAVVNINTKWPRRQHPAAGRHAGLLQSLLRRTERPGRSGWRGRIRWPRRRLAACAWFRLHRRLARIHHHQQPRGR